MLSDVLRGQRCPDCGCSALHPEAPAERVEAHERVELWPLTEPVLRAAFLRVLRWTICCAVCGTTWQIAAAGSEIATVGELQATLRELGQ